MSRMNRAYLVLFLHTCWLETILASQPPPPPPPPPPPHSVTVNNRNIDSIKQKAEDDYTSSRPPFVNALQESTSSDGTPLLQHEKKTETTFITRQQAESFGTTDDDTTRTTQQRLDLSQGKPNPPPPPLTTREHIRTHTVVEQEVRKQFVPNEQEWIVPQRYSNPYGLPDPKISPNQSQLGTIQEEYSQGEYYRQQTPSSSSSRIHQPQMPPRQLAPRDYNFNRIPPREQYHEQRLVVRNSQQYQQRQGLGRSLLQRIGKSLDVLADADTVVSKQAQKLVSSVPSISESIAGNISGAVRGTVFEVINRGTGIKEAMKDTVKGSVSTIFGGAPTTASETQDAWEQDRRKTVTETRRRTLLGTTSGETYTGTGTSPLQEHLNMLMEEQNKQERDHAKNIPDDKDEFKVDSDTNNHVNDNEYADDKHYYGNTQQNVDTDSGVDPQTFFQTRTPLSSYASKETSTYANDDEDDENNFPSNFKKLFHLRMKPRRLLFFHRKTSDSFSDAGWGDEDDDIQPKIIKKPSNRPTNLMNDARIVNSDFEESLLRRQQKASPLAQKGTVNLLSTKDLQYLSKIGKSKAIMDFVSIFFLYTAAFEASKYMSFNYVLTDSFPDSVQELLQTAKLFIPSCDKFGLLHSWFPHAVAASILTMCTRNLRYGKRVERVTKDIAEGVKASVLESQLRLRILTGFTSTRQFMDICGMASMKQVAATIEISRVRHFVFISMITILFTTVSVMRPICEQILNSVSALISLDSMHTWPIDWSKSFLEIRDIVITMFTRLHILATKEWVLIIENPFAVISTVALVAVLFIFCQLTGMFKAFSSIASSTSPIELGVNTKDQEIDLIEKISAIGKSSAIRLAILLNDGSADTIVATWKRFQSSPKGMNLKTFVRQTPFHLKMTYSTLCWVLALIPIAIETYVKINHASILNWSHMVASILLLNVTRSNARKALLSAMDSASYNAILAPYLSLLAQIFTDIDKSKANTGANRAISTSISNAGGIVVTDLWVAHVSKRSWACRGTSFECKPGEVIVILGDDGCGKTRLLTSLCELIIAPPNRARTTNYARGSVAVGGLDINTWHRESLKRKLGIFLKGTKSTSDLANFYTGSSLSDVLRPCSSSGIDEGTMRSSMDLAMQFTSLSATLLPRLENRLSSIVISNEDDVSSTNDSFLLSHSDWSKVLLTKSISQAIFNNDNPMAPNNTLKNCLLGSIMFLDDITSNMNEAEEIKLINALKNSGATTLMTSSKWAVGRHADKIIILKNGSIVESGTHDDLLSRGSKNSLYAQRWSQIRA